MSEPLALSPEPHTTTSWMKASDSSASQESGTGRPARRAGSVTKTNTLTPMAR